MFEGSHRQRHIAGFCFAAAAAVAAFSRPASAEPHGCRFGPGANEVLVGSIPGGQVGLADMPLCEYKSQGQGAEQAPPPRPLTEEEVKMAVPQLLRVQAQQALSKFKSGEWILGQSCDARFVSRDGVITAGVFKGRPYLMFSGIDIPVSDKVKTVRIVLERVGEAPVTVEALHGAGPITGLGALQVFEAPMTANAFDAMSDKADFRIRLDDAQVFAMGWRGATKARDKLHQCAS